MTESDVTYNRLFLTHIRVCCANDHEMPLKTSMKRAR